MISRKTKREKYYTFFLFRNLFPCFFFIYLFFTAFKKTFLWQSWNSLQHGSLYKASIQLSVHKVLLSFQPHRDTVQGENKRVLQDHDAIYNTNY